MENTDLLHNGSRRKRQVVGRMVFARRRREVGEVPEKSNVRNKKQRQKKQNRITRPPSVTGGYADLVIWLVILRIGCGTSGVVGQVSSVCCLGLGSFFPCLLLRIVWSFGR